MRRFGNWIVLFLLIAACVGCAGLAEFFGDAGKVIADPEVQEHVGGVVSNVISGNWIRALANLGELLAVGGATWKVTNMSRDKKRAARGEPTGLPPLP